MATLTCPGEWPGVDRSDLAGQLMVGLDQLVESGLDDRRNRVGDRGLDTGGLCDLRRHVTELGVLLAPVLPFGTPEQVAGIREGRDPAGAVPSGVPADVVGVKVRAQHDVD